MKVIHNKDSTLYFSQRLWRSVSKYVFSSNCFRFLATVWKVFRIWSKRRYKNPYNLALQKICIKNEKGSRYGPFDIINYQETLLLPSLIEITLLNGCSFVDLKHIWWSPFLINNLGSLLLIGNLVRLQILTYIQIYIYIYIYIHIHFSFRKQFRVFI